MSGHMKWSQTLIPTSKEVPADATVASQALLLRAGYIRQVAAGIYSLLPLGTRVFRKVEHVIRQELEAAGAAEVFFPVLQPLDLFQRSARARELGPELIRVADRHGRNMVLAPSGEEVVAELLAATVRSYRQLPLTLFQLRERYCDLDRPGAGLLRVRESRVAEAYSVHADDVSLAHAHERLVEVWERAINRCGTPPTRAETDGGYAFVVPCDAGEDVVVTSDRSDYAATVDRAETGVRSWTFGGDPLAELERVYTPRAASVPDVAKLMGVTPADVLKTLVFRAAPVEQWTGYETAENYTSPKWLVAVVRGDHEVNVVKLRRAAREHFHIASIELADDETVRAHWAIGFVGPDEAVRKLQAAVVVDPDAAQSRAWVAGGNEPDYHVRSFNWFRECGQPLADPRKVAVADIRNAVPGDPSPRGDGGMLRYASGVEVGRAVIGGTRLCDVFAATVQGETGKSRSVLMATYRVDIARLVAATVEQSHDEQGIVWPAAIAPYRVVLTPIAYSGAAREVADRLDAELTSAGIDVLLDDRDLRPGAKFADADLIGVPVRVNIGERGLKEGIVEVKRRTTTEAERVPPSRVAAVLRGELAAAELAPPVTPIDPGV